MRSSRDGTRWRYAVHRKKHAIAVTGMVMMAMLAMMVMLMLMMILALMLATPMDPIPH